MYFDISYFSESFKDTVIMGNDFVTFTGLAEGECQIVYQVTSLGETKSINIKVSGYAEGFSPAPKSIELNPAVSVINNVFSGDIIDYISATVLPENAGNKNVSWSSSDTNVATVSPEGIVKIQGSGNATITVQSVENGVKATFQINAKQLNQSLLVSPKEVTMKVGEKIGISIQPVPKDSILDYLMIKKGENGLINEKDYKGDEFNAVGEGEIDVEFIPNTRKSSDGSPNYDFSRSETVHFKIIGSE